MRRRTWWTLLLMVAGLAASGAQTPEGAVDSGGEDLLALVRGLDATITFDPIRSGVRIERGTRSFGFGIGSTVASVDFTSTIRIDAARIDGGRVVVPATLADEIRRQFPPLDLGRRVGAVFIDAGHGGRDPGAIGRVVRDGESSPLQEKDVVLEVALDLGGRLAERYPDREIIYSRNSDVYLTLEERTQLANAIPLDVNESVVFVSIHANASPNRAAQGFEVWVLPPEYRRSNLVDAAEVGVEDPDLLSILNTMREEEISIESELLARNVLVGLDARIGRRSPNRGLRQESWYVVRNARMPSILVEVGFVTNLDEAARLSNPAYLQEVADGIYSGVVNFIERYERVDAQ